MKACLRKPQGFTLIELMIVVAVVGTLAAIAYPAYTDSVLKGRRAQARAALSELLQQQERYMTQNNCYLAFSNNSSGVASATAPSPATACGGATASSVPFRNFAGESLARASYMLTATVCPGAGSATLSIATCVKVVASPIRTDAAVGNLEMTSSGSKTCTGTASSSNPRLCWP